jgi:flagellar basal-body rod modification protein FlgD
MITIGPLASSAQAPAPAASSVPQSEELTQFLSLLTAQVQNQDPLQPLDSTAFVEQLATFSALEQQVQTNKHLEAILAALAGD